MSKSIKFSNRAIHILEKANLIWSNSERSYVEVRHPDEETTAEYRNRALLKISYEEMRDHGLLQSASASEQELGLKWLRKRLLVGK